MRYWTTILVGITIAAGVCLLGSLAEEEERLTRKALHRARRLRLKRAQRFRRTMEGERSRIAERIHVLDGLLDTALTPAERASLEATLRSQEDALRAACPGRGLSGLPTAWPPMEPDLTS